MEPRNVLRVKEALLSLLAGDIYGRTPIWASLGALKAIYYAVSLANFRRTYAAWQQRRKNIRDVGRAGRRERGRGAMSRAARQAAIAAIGAAAVVVLLAAAGLARAAEPKPLWELGIGAAGLHLPHYRGSDQSHNVLLPVPYVDLPWRHYQGRPGRRARRALPG